MSVNGEGQQHHGSSADKPLEGLVIPHSDGGGPADSLPPKSPWIWTIPEKVFATAVTASSVLLITAGYMLNSIINGDRYDAGRKAGIEAVAQRTGDFAVTVTCPDDKQPTMVASQTTRGSSAQGAPTTHMLIPGCSNKKDGGKLSRPASVTTQLFAPYEDINKLLSQANTANATTVTFTVGSDGVIGTRFAELPGDGVTATYFTSPEAIGALVLGGALPKEN